MPMNNDLEPVVLPMEQKWGKEPTTEFINNLDAISVKLVDAPSLEQLFHYIPAFVGATWADRPMGKYTRADRARAVRAALTFKTLPTALETISLTFAISGISLQEVTHIIRYRKGSFSAECSGDKWWTDKIALIPNSIQNSVESGIRERYEQLVRDAKQLYCDMIDTHQISIMDARYILPRCLETFYYMRVSFSDAIHFIRQRIDKQIQPETDNIIAYQMYEEILRAIPFAFGLVNIHAPAMFYVNTARTGKATNLYFPDEDSDKFEWHEKDFLYQCTRDQVNGTDPGATNHFNKLLREHERTIDYLEDQGRRLYRLYLEEEGEKE